MVELLIVMAIMGILTVSVVSLYGAIRKLEKERATKKEMEEIKKSIVNYYEKNLVLASYDSSYVLPVDALELPPSAQKDENYKDKYYAYVATNQGNPFDTLKVDNKSIGTTAAVLISSGRNLKFDDENSTLSDGVYAQEGSSSEFDDILIYISQSELEASISWRREIEEELAVLNQAAQILAENDDDGDGYVDEDTTDPSGDWDSLTDWTLVSGVSSLTSAGLVTDADKVVDPWGIEYIWDSTQHKFYSSGPNKTDEWGMGDDIGL